MSRSIQCTCGYVGPSVSQGPVDVCPICRTAFAAVPSLAPSTTTQQPISTDDFPGLDDTPLSSRSTLRIPCPKGHVNVTPSHMLGTQVVCPKCNAFYTLQMADSLEYLQIADREARKLEEKEAKKWLNRAIFAVVFIVVSLVGMIVFSVLARSG